jgi:GDP-L-fucose synthase
MDQQSRIFVAGHRGLVGSALTRRLEGDGYTGVIVRNRSELDLTNGPAVSAFFREFEPEYVFLAAAKVGGIRANLEHPAEFIQTNLAIQDSVIHSAHATGVKRLIFFGSNCAYPKECAQPMAEEVLTTGPLEPSSEPYAMAKLAGMKMCQSYNQQYGDRFISVIPATVYGPNDNFDPNSAHVLSALMARFQKAKQENLGEAVVWGTGTPRREFIYAEDLADACMHLMTMEEEPLRAVAEGSRWVLNAGSGADQSILELAAQIKDAVGFQGDLVPDPTQPDGISRRLLDSSRLQSTGWSSRTKLADGLEDTFRWYQESLLNPADRKA